MKTLDKMNLIALSCASLLLSLFTMVSYGHVYNVFGGGIAMFVSLFFGIAAVISIFKLIKKARECQTKRS